LEEVIEKLLNIQIDSLLSLNFTKEITYYEHQLLKMKNNEVEAYTKEFSQ